MSIITLYHSIKEPLKRVESIIEATLQDADPKIQTINHHLLKAPGKRLRPALTILSYKGTQKTKDVPDSVVKIAAAIELIHLASLVHDDAIDLAPIRRNQASVFGKWGNAVAVTMGVYLYSKSLTLISEVGNNDVLADISDTVTQLCQGELHQVIERGNAEITTPVFFSKIVK